MIYDYRCSNCGNVQEDECSVNVFKEHHPACVKCGGVCDYQFSPTNVQFILKDGPSGSWPSKGERFKKFRAKASEAAAKRQKERYKTPTLVPNFNGKQTETWKEAQIEASKEAGPAVAASYNEKVKEESKAKS